MKTKAIPALLTLTAGLITCLMNIYNHVDLMEFVKSLLIVLLIFYFLGSIIKLILDKSLNDFDDPLSDIEDDLLEDELVDDNADMDDYSEI